MRFGSTSQFAQPPSSRGSTGTVRTVGFEIEYAGVNIDQSATIVQQVFGGEIEPTSTFVNYVHAPVGSFAVEIDAAILKDKKYEKPLRAVGIDPDAHDMKWLEEALLGAASTIVPTEISTPAIPIDRLDSLEDLRDKLRQSGAKGTRASVVYAFGLHINPEAIDPHDVAALRDHLRSTILLYPWLKSAGETDIARRISPYIKPFPNEYARLILNPEYTPDQDRLIDDYLEYNPSRNRPLDMTPLFMFVDRDRVCGRTAEMQLVKARPTYHYRLPNCMIDEPGWTLAEEWNRWVVVERLAGDRARLSRMCRDYLDADRAALRPIIDPWPQALAQYVRGLL